MARSGDAVKRRQPGREHAISKAPFERSFYSEIRALVVENAAKTTISGDFRNGSQGDPLRIRFSSGQAGQEIRDRDKGQPTGDRRESQACPCGSERSSW